MVKKGYAVKSFCASCMTSFDRYQSKNGICPNRVWKDKHILSQTVENGKVLNTFRIIRFKEACNKPLVFKSICKLCNLPRKSFVSTPDKLTRFETELSEELRINQKNFEFERKLTFCSSVTCENERLEIDSFKIGVEELMVTLGVKQTKNARRKFIRYGKV